VQTALSDAEAALMRCRDQLQTFASEITQAELARATRDERAGSLGFRLRCLLGLINNEPTDWEAPDKVDQGREWQKDVDRLQEGQRWVQEYLVPWANARRLQRVRGNWTRWREQEDVEIKVKHLLVNDKTEAIAFLKGRGICCKSPSGWENAEFRSHRRSSMKIVTAWLQVKVTPNDALFRLLTEDMQCLKNGDKAYGVVLEEEQTNADRPEAIITPRSDVQRCQMEAWRRMWRILGASEAQILELIGFLVEVTVPGWKSVCVVTEGLDQPACLETVWGSSKLRESRGKIRVVSSVNPLHETQRNALVYLEDIWSV
jgi:hypothetical protein